MGAPVGTVLYGDVIPWWVVHGYTHAMVAEFSEVVARGVRDVVEVWCEVRFSSVLVDEVAPRRGGGEAGG